MHSVFVGTLFGIVSFVIGLILIYIVKRRRFYRRGAGGLQHFRTYGGSIFHRLWESFAMLVGIVLLIVGGMLIAERINYEMLKSKKAKSKKEAKIASSRLMPHNHNITLASLIVP